MKLFPMGSGSPLGAPRNSVRALNDVSLTVWPGRTLAIVGESGCGKTTLGRLILRLDRPTAGSVRFRGSDLWSLKGSELRRYRDSVQAVFQDPWGSLNPMMAIWEIVGEPLIVRNLLPRDQLKARIIEVLSAVGLQPHVAYLRPGALSGGIRQRVAIARALAVSPALIVLDEPLSSLDASVQAGVMNLLRDLQASRGIAYVLISHDFHAVRYLADEIAVMYLGEIVEHGSADAVLKRPLHPYSNMLLQASGEFADGGDVDSRFGELPSPTRPPAGCKFHPRCPLAMSVCASDSPERQAIAAGRTVACHLYPRVSDERGRD